MQKHYETLDINYFYGAWQNICLERKKNFQLTQKINKCNIALGGIMNLIEKFENMPFQDVGTFNSIFKYNPILGHSHDSEVEILGVYRDNLRIIKVNGELIHKDLTHKTLPAKIKAQIKKTEIERAVSQTKKLPDIYKLKPTQFMIYSALKELGYVVGAADLARQLNLSNKTVLTNLQHLIKLELVTKKRVVTNSGSFSKLIAN